MNVASVRNCVSTSHFAAATCHYCTITVCLLSLCRAQASQSDNHSQNFAKGKGEKPRAFFPARFSTGTRWKVDRTDRVVRCVKTFFFPFLIVSPVDFAQSISRANSDFRNANLVRASTLYIWILLYSLTTDWTLSVLCVDGHAWRSLYPVWYVSTFILLIILHY